MECQNEFNEEGERLVMDDISVPWIGEDHAAVVLIRRCGGFVRWAPRLTLENATCFTDADPGAAILDPQAPHYRFVREDARLLWFRSWNK